MNNVNNEQLQQVSAAQPAPAPKTFDFSSLRLKQPTVTEVGVKKLITAVPVRKPHKQEFVRVHPDQGYWFPAAAIVLKDQHNETYLVSPAIASEIGADCMNIMLFTTVNKQGVVSLWPVRMPAENGRQDAYSRTALEIAAGIATKSWVKVVANQSLGAYEAYQAQAGYGEPEWPDVPFEKLMEIAFRGRIIESLDHDVLKRLRGEA